RGTASSSALDAAGPAAMPLQGHANVSPLTTQNHRPLIPTSSQRGAAYHGHFRSAPHELHSSRTMTTPPNSPGQSAFDTHHPPATELINQCVHCGFCLPTCPTYALWGNEMDSPRGRIYLMKMASEGKAQMTPEWVQHIDTCLGCVACMTACPSGVDYGKLIEATRAQVERNFRGAPFRGPRSWFERLHRKMIFATFPRPERLRVMRWPLMVYQQSGLQWLVRQSGLLKLVPKRLRAMETLLPALEPVEAVAEATPAVGERRLRVGLVLGCVQREFLSHVNAATVRVLAAEGCEVA